MQVEHELVITRAVAYRQAHPGAGTRQSPAHRAATRRIQPLCLHDPGHKGMKGRAHPPDTARGGIDVDEDAQNPSAMSGPGGKSVHVQEVISLMQRQLPALFLERAEARKVQLEPARIRRKKLRDKPRSLLGEAPHHALQALAVGSVGKTAEHVARRAIGDIFVETRLGGVAREQELSVVLGKLERNFTKKQDLAALELITIPAGLFRGITLHLNGL